MSVSTPDEISIEALAEDFLDRRRRGERPTLDEYVARYPAPRRRDPRVLPGARVWSRTSSPRRAT